MQADRSSILVIVALFFFSCANKEHAHSQQQSVTAQPDPTHQQIKSLPGGSCEGCDLMFLGMPSKISSVDTTDGWFEKGQRLKIEGTIFKSDQKTPASDVILYYYHTDQKGYYTPKDHMPQGARRHGYLRGWIKTGTDGKYTIYTSRPSQYPNENFEAHLHVFVKEPFLDSPYYISEWIFDDDPLVTKALRDRLENRGGSGILKTTLENDVQVAKHDVILGMNIPGYPK